MVSYILITGYSILLFINPLNFVAVILKVLLVNLLAALNFANVFFKIKKRLEKTLKRKKRYQIFFKKRKKRFFTSMVRFVDRFPRSSGG